MDIIRERTETERVAYLVGQYFIGKINLNELKLQLNLIHLEND